MMNIFNALLLCLLLGVYTVEYGSAAAERASPIAEVRKKQARMQRDAEQRKAAAALQQQQQQQQKQKQQNNAAQQQKQQQQAAAQQRRQNAQQQNQQKQNNANAAQKPPLNAQQRQAQAQAQAQRRQQQQHQQKAQAQKVNPNNQQQQQQQRQAGVRPQNNAGTDTKQEQQKASQQQQKNPQQQKAKQVPKVMGVIDLQASNFDASVRDGSAWLIEFYAPWCGHCKRFAPTYEKVATTLHAKHPAQQGEDDRRVMVAKVDGSADRALASRFSIRGYPTFFLVDGWNVYEYEGDRTLEELVDFATEDYIEYEPIPFLNSPFGPMGQLRAMFILAGTKAISSFEWMVNEKGFSEPVAAIMMIGLAIIVGMFLIIFIGLMSVSKPKTD